MEQKKIKIVGLSINQQLGILNACKMQFNEENKLIAVKGAVGEGKTTLQKGLQLGTLGSKTLTDNNLYGDIDIETQLLDGEIKLFVGCKSKEGKLSYVLYTKDENGKKIKDPVIDGVKATPAKYLDALQTSLTWRMQELTSENNSVQSKLLLKLYQHQFKKLGIIFDKYHPDYSGTILEKLDKALSDRDYLDMVRKKRGGIADDLKKQGYDPERPETLPKAVNLEEIEKQIKQVENAILLKETTGKNKLQNKLQQLKLDAQEIVTQVMQINASEEKKWNEAINDYNKKWDVNIDITENIKSITLLNDDLQKEYITEFISKLEKEKYTDLEPSAPALVKIINSKIVEVPKEALLNNEIKILVEKYDNLKEMYMQNYELLQNYEVDTTEEEKKIVSLLQEQKEAKEINTILDAVASFYDWQDSNLQVTRLKDDFLKLLLQVDTGVQGLFIQQDETTKNITLMYDGSFDPVYFNNPNKELRKVSSYSGTQKPVICLLIQNYLLNQKPKAMRYMYIDDVPIDNKTRDLLERMGAELDLTIFLNITGDFEQNSLQQGEILIQGGEIFFNNEK